MFVGVTRKRNTTSRNMVMVDIVGLMTTNHPFTRRRYVSTMPYARTRNVKRATNATVRRNVKRSKSTAMAAMVGTKIEITVPKMVNR